MPKNKHLKLLISMLYIVISILGAWLSIKYLIPWFAPFILAFTTASIIEPTIRYCTVKLNFKRSIAAVLCSVITISSLIGLSAFIITKVIYEIVSFAKALPYLLVELPDIYTIINKKVYNFITAAPIEIQEYLSNMIETLISKLSVLPITLSGQLLNIVSNAIAHTPKIILFIVTYAIGVIFISISYNDIKNFIIRQIPDGFRSKAYELKNSIFLTLGRWLRAELILMLITFAELSISFLLLRIDYACLVAVTISVIDALPVLGIGTVLIPWSIAEFILGSSNMAFSLIATYLIIITARSFLEPKIVGKQLGLPSITTLISIYVGYSCAGICGMLLFPIAALFIKQMSDAGYISIIK